MCKQDLHRRALLKCNWVRSYRGAILLYSGVVWGAGWSCSLGCSIPTGQKLWDFGSPAPFIQRVVHTVIGRIKPYGRGLSTRLHTWGKSCKPMRASQATLTDCSSYHGHRRVSSTLWGPVHCTMYSGGLSSPEVGGSNSGWDRRISRHQ